MAYLDSTGLNTLWNKIKATFATASHTQSANTISAGTLAGQTVANSTAVSTLTTGQVRNIYISTSSPTSSDGNNGDIWIKY